jgi:hypothetical protein
MSDQGWTFGRKWSRYDSQQVELVQSSIKSKGALLKYMRALAVLNFWLEAAIGADATHHSWMVFESPLDLYATMSVIGFRWSTNSRRWITSFKKRPRTVNEIAKLKSLSKAAEWLERYVRIML